MTTKDLLIKTTKDIYDNIDLGTPFEINIFIYNETAYFVCGLEVGQCEAKNLGSKIAESILLHGLYTPNNYGSFWLNSNLKSIDDVLNFKDNDFDFDTTLLKLWEVTRVVCNTAKNNVVYYINYSAENDNVYFDKADSCDEKAVSKLFDLFE